MTESWPLAALGRPSRDWCVEIVDAPGVASGLHVPGEVRWDRGTGQNDRPFAHVGHDAVSTEQDIFGLCSVQNGNDGGIQQADGLGQRSCGAAFRPKSLGLRRDNVKPMRDQARPQAGLAIPYPIDPRPMTAVRNGSVISRTSFCTSVYNRTNGWYWYRYRYRYQLSID